MSNDFSTSSALVAGEHRTLLLPLRSTVSGLDGCALPRMRSCAAITAMLSGEVAAIAGAISNVKLTN